MVLGRLRNRSTDIRIRHPGYDDDVNTLFTVYGIDHPDGGVHYETVRIACGIIAGNRWDGVLTPFANYNPDDAPKGHFFIGTDAYFHLPDWQPNDASDSQAQLKRRYPILVRYDEWRFPHGNLPQIWKDVLPHPERAFVFNEGVMQKLYQQAQASWDAKVQSDKETAEIEDALDGLGSICDPQGGEVASVLEAQLATSSVENATELVQSKEALQAFQALSRLSKGQDDDRDGDSDSAGEGEAGE